MKNNKNSKSNNNKDNSNLIILFLVVGLLIFLIFNKDKKQKEGFTDSELTKTREQLLGSIKEQLKEKYNKDNYVMSEEVLNKLAANELVIQNHGLNPSRQMFNRDKYVLKSSLEADNMNECRVENASNKDQYIHKNQIPYQPKIDMDKYVLKSSIPPEKKCPPQKEIDYSKYVLKSSIPPVQKCPPCICPKVKVEAGLCKKAPPPPKCPAPEPCPPPPSCPDVKPCPVPKQEVVHKLKYIKVPTFIEKKVLVDKDGNVVNELVNNKSIYKNNNHRKMNNRNNNPKINNNSYPMQKYPRNNDVNEMVEQEYESEQQENNKKYYRHPNSISRSGIDRINNLNFDLNSTYSNYSNPITGNKQHIHF